jgi:uncharacterized damage-inducible protein DinB
MNEQLNDLVADLERVSADARKNFGHLSAEQLNWKPSAEAWSVGQCLEHLIVTNKSYFDELDGVIAGTRKNSFWEKWSPLTSFAGKLLIDSLKSEGRKVKTTAKMTPPSEVAPGVVENFAAHQSELIEKIKRAAGADWRKIVLTSPFAKMMTYTLADGLQSIVEHERRHLRQAERVAGTENFPRQ